MSITGRSQDIATKRSSWETLEIPVPLNNPLGARVIRQVQEISRISILKVSEKSEKHVQEKQGGIEKLDVSPNAGLVIENEEEKNESLKTAREHSYASGVSEQQLVDTHILIATPRESNTRNTIVSTGDELVRNDSGVSSASGTTLEKRTAGDNLVDKEILLRGKSKENINTDNTKEPTLETTDTHREDTGATDDSTYTHNTSTTGTATYVSTQPHKTDDIDSIVHEFETYARKSRAVTRENNQEIEEEGEREHSIEEELQATQSPHSKYREISPHRRSAYSNQSEHNLPTSVPSTVQVERSFTQESTFIPKHSNIDRSMADSGKMARSRESADSTRTSNRYHDNESAQRTSSSNERHTEASEYVRTVKTPKEILSETNDRLKDTTPVGQKKDKHVSPNKDNHVSPNKDRKGDISSCDRKSSARTNSTITIRPNPVGLDNLDLKAFSGQSMSSHGYPQQEFHPSPVRQENGISRENLLDVLTKGLGDFTKDMAEVVLNKLKAENECLANQVAYKVKEEAIQELKDMKEQVSTLESEKVVLIQERDKLKIDIIKDKENMKREYEKEKLKRVKEFEEKNELIAKYEAENEKLQKQMKERDTMAKKSEKKVKIQEEKTSKLEEEYENKLKELQKQLDRAKGDLLVRKSKKRLQTMSARKREETRLISHHGSRPLIKPPHVPYVEGDP